MPFSSFYTTEHPTYPGEYIPLPEVEAMVNDMKKSGKNFTSTLPVNMDEYEDCFKIMVPVPGTRPENIHIYVQDDVLSILVLNMDKDRFKKEKIRMHEFETALPGSRILLPENADSEFITAEYNQGILSLHIPKAQTRSKPGTTEIVVY